MKSTLPCIVIVTLFWTIAFAPTTANSGEKKSSAFKAEDLTWLTGMWSMEINGEMTEEFWMAPRGNFMPGVNRTFNRTTGRSAFEYMRIADGPDGLSFFASPSGRPATVFPVKELKDQSVTFENLKSDFPSLIHYRRDGDKLHAKISGTINGADAEMSWTWDRVKEDTK